MRRTRSQLGAAMTETVVSLPLILLLLAMMVYFGLNMQRWQRASMSSRYEAWRQMDDGVHSLTMLEDDAERIDELFLAGNAEEVTVNVSFGRATAAEQMLKDEAARISPDALDWMETMLSLAPGTRGVGVTASYETPEGIMSRFAGPLRHHHVVLDGDWLYAPQLYLRGSDRPRDMVWPVIHEVFYEDMAARFDPLVSGGNGVAGSIWSQHVIVPWYNGPGDEDYWDQYR